jgi:hypothetical protein
MKTLTEKELIEYAAIAVEKGIQYEDFKYSDWMYGHESQIDEVWKYVEECEENGRTAFREKYKAYHLGGL